MRKFLPASLLIIGSIFMCPLPSECNPTRNLNGIHSSHSNTRMALKNNSTRIESSLERIFELGPVSKRQIIRIYLCNKN